MNDLVLIETIWVDDPSVFCFWMDDPVWVGDPDFEGELFFMVGSGRANLKPLPVLLPPRREVPVALGSMAVSP